MQLVRDANSFIQSHEPWLLVKSPDSDDLAALQCVLHVGLETARVVSLALSPVIPRLSHRILVRLGVADCSSREHMTRCVAAAGQRLGPDIGPLLTRRTRPSASSAQQLHST